MCRYWRWLMLALVIVASGGELPPVAAGDFGLAYTVPGFDGNFRAGVGSGLVALVKANASLTKYELEADRSGATALLHGVANNITSPLNQLLGHVAASFGANGTDSLRAMAEELAALTEPTTAALDVALASSRTLDGTIRAALGETLVANVTTIRTEVGTLALTWPPFAEALAKAGAPDSGVSASSVSTVVTPELVQSVSSPVRLINAALGDIAAAFSVVAKERATAIGHESTNNGSVNHARQDLENQLSVVNRTLADAARQMEQQANGTLRQIRDGHNGILSRLASDAPDVATVRMFLETVEAQLQRHNGRTGELWRTLSANHSAIVRASADAIAARLIAATEALTDAAAFGDGGYVERCLQRHVSELRGGQYAPTRLSGCYQADGRSPNYFTSAHSSFLEQLRNGAVYAAAQAQSVCAQSSPNCTTMYLQTLAGVGSRNQARLDAFDAFLEQEMGALSERYDMCARAIPADVDALVALNAQKFTSCLVTGR